ncbi:hypothetical protein MCOR02_001544 [Pyricularia oryzae]|nr:hypothetical protein MCOR02_001544 [Pyricularia oryzae]KAI6391962.1 hypothetical protein MCOR24_010027 [Pyricularia oryzae]
MPNVSSTPALLAIERKPSFVQFAVPLINSEPPSPPAPTLSPWGAARHDCGHRLVLCHLFCSVPGGLVWGQIQVQFECCATLTEPTTLARVFKANTASTGHRRSDQFAYVCRRDRFLHIRHLRLYCL